MNCSAQCWWLVLAGALAGASIAAMAMALLQINRPRAAMPPQRSDNEESDL
jgi:hypothetical protein